MTQKSSKNLFVGLWTLDPSQAQYEFGSPPQRGTYSIESSRTGLTFTANWLTVDEESYQVSFHGIPDGQEYAYENPEIADTLATTMVNAHTLDTTIKKSRRILAHTRRVLSADAQTMTITQSGINDKGTWFNNISVYMRTTP